MAVPSDAEQVVFLQQVQRLLTEGQFTSTYKFALLHALADLAVEKGTDEGETLAISSADLAEKFSRCMAALHPPAAREPSDSRPGGGPG